MGIRIVRLSPGLLASILRGLSRPCRSDAPADLEVIGVLGEGPPGAADAIDILCRSAEWPEFGPSELPPEPVEITFTEVEPAS